ncbi:MAG: hypothetical protein KGD60_08985, partial [Candidatus Thorarchaeota archaeon]|nr:hypothetical protein [Candidatus Thorarchaeota archaeon]
KYMGVVSALTNISRTTGFSIATALVTTIFGIFFLIANPGGLTSGPIFTAGYGQAVVNTIWVFSILCIIAAVISSMRGTNQSEDERINNEKSIEATNQIPQQ